ncbi:MAG: hypothetical protein GY854_17325 [Deltaproteobacteria bacterium]|nr:hypothetical protein [Deltaproteobacteria bacterium]
MAGKCVTHPDEYLLYCCEQCGESFCEECLVKRDVGIATRAECPTCHIPVERTGPGEVPVGDMTTHILTGLFHSKSGIVIFLVGTVVCGGLTVLKSLSDRPIEESLSDTGRWLALLLISYGIFGTFIAWVVKSSSKGRFRIDPPTSFSEYSSEIWQPFKVICYLSIVTCFPLIAFFFFRFHSSIFSEDQVFMLSELSFEGIDLIFIPAFALYGVFCLPMSIAIALHNDNPTEAWNPVLIIRTISRMPRVYFTILLLMVLTLILIGGATILVDGFFAKREDAFQLSVYIGWLFRFYGGFICAALLGAMIFTNNEALEIERKKISHDPEKYLRTSYAPPPPMSHDVLHGDAPKGRDLFNVDPIEISDSSGTAAAKPNALEIEHQPVAHRVSVPPPAPVPRPSQIPTLDETCRAYKQRVATEPRFVLQSEMQWAVASRFEELGHFQEAAEAFAKMGSLGMEDTRAADGLLRGSFIVYKQLGDRQTAAQLLRRLIECYPASPQMDKAIRVLAAIDRQG